MSDRARILDRIRKCMALSKSPEEHEAAAALRQAQKLMELHSVSPDEVDLVEYTSDFVDHDDYEWGNRKPMIITCVCDLMCRAFTLSYTWECSPDRKHRVRYFGKKANVMLATHSHAVVYRAILAAWRKITREQPWIKGPSARASFALGWCASVISKIQNLAPEGEEEERIKKAKAQHYGQPLDEAKLGTNMKDVDNTVAGVGYAAGKDFSINRPIDTDRRRLEKL